MSTIRQEKRFWQTFYRHERARYIQMRRCSLKNKDETRHVTREEVLEAHRKDPSGKLLGRLLEEAGVGAVVKPSRDWEKYIPLPRMFPPTQEELLMELNTPETLYKLGWSEEKLRRMINDPDSPLRSFAAKLIELREEARKANFISERRDRTPLLNAFKELLHKLELYY